MKCKFEKLGEKLKLNETMVNAIAIAEVDNRLKQKMVTIDLDIDPKLMKRFQKIAKTLNVELNSVLVAVIRLYLKDNTTKK